MTTPTESRVSEEAHEARNRCWAAGVEAPTCVFKRSEASGAYVCTQAGCGQRFYAESLEPVRRGLCRNANYMDAKIVEAKVSQGQTSTPDGPMTLADAADQFRAAARRLARPGTVRIVLTVTDKEMYLEVDTRDADTLRRDGISMRDVRGEWIEAK